MKRFTTLVLVLLGTVSLQTRANDVINVKLIAEPTPTAYEIGTYVPIFSISTNSGERVPFLSWKLRVNCKENAVPAAGDKCAVKNTTTRWMSLVHKTPTGLSVFNFGPNDTYNISAGEKLFSH